MPVEVNRPSLAAVVKLWAINACSFDRARRCLRISVVAGLFLTPPLGATITAPSVSIDR